MPWDPTPWMVGGGAVHSTNVARLLAYVGFAGREGIVGPRDLEVRALAVPGPQIRVFPGACGILNRATGVKYEAYAGRLPEEDIVDVGATDAGGGRSDLVVARVENPHITSEDWPAPADPAVGPYIFSRIVPNVPPTTRTATELGLPYSMIALARLDIPVSTATIQQAHIVDLRQLCQVLREREQNLVQPTGNDVLNESAYGRLWPGVLKTPTTPPPWATRAKVLAIIAGAKYGPGSTQGDLRIDLGGTVSGVTITTPGVKSQVTAYNVDSADVDRTTVYAGGTLAVPASMRGVPTTIQVEGRRTAGTSALESDALTTCWIDVEYTATPEPNE